MNTFSNDPFVFLHGRGLGPDSADSVARALSGTPLLVPQGGVALRHRHTWFENRQVGIAEPDSVAVV